MSIAVSSGVTLAKLYAQVKGVNAIIKSGGAASGVLGKMVAAINDDIQLDKLKDVYEALEDIQIEGLNADQNSLSPDVVKLGLLIPAVLYSKYKTSHIFRYMHIPGERDGKRNSLAMQDFYIGLSAIDYQEELNDRRSLVKKEMTLSSALINQSSISNMVDQAQYLSTTLINEYSKVLVYGNPGVGKSTYARYICNQWAEDQITLKHFPIYVNLRYCDFTKGGLITYIKNTYFPDVDDIKIKHTLITLSSWFTFILDGYDEVSELDKQSLQEEIRQWKQGAISSIRYMILGRPYGFINNTFTDIEKSIVIDGLNTIGVKNYISKAVDLPKKQKELLDIIYDNLVLKDYAHIPLMLSYMALIYNSGAKGRDTLSGIESMYALYNQVNNWMISYALSEKGKLQFLNEDINQLELLALKMTIEKRFVYTIALSEDKYEKAIQYAAQSGIANLEEQAYQRQFSFYSITIQEFYTARLIKDDIDTDKFWLLAQDAMYWNVCKLIIGGVTQQSLRTKLLASISSTGSELFPEYRRALYFTLLAECTEVFIHDALNKSDIKNLVDSYVKSYFDQEWRPIVNDAAKKLFSKSNSKIQNTLNDILLEYLQQINSCTDHTVHEKFLSYTVMDICSLVNFDKSEIYKLVLETVTTLINKHNQLKATTGNISWEEQGESLDAERMLFDISFVLVRILDQAEKKKIELFALKIEALKNIVPYDLRNDIAYIQTKYENIKNTFGELESYELRLSTPSDENTQIQAVFEISLDLYKVFISSEKHEADETRLIKDCVKALIAQIEVHNENHTEDERLFHAGEMISEGLASQNPQLYLDEMIHLYMVAGCQEILLITDDPVFKSRLDQVLDNIDKDLGEDDIIEFCFLMSNTQNGHFVFPQYVDKYEMILTRWINVHLQDLGCSLDKYDDLPDSITRTLEMLMDVPQDPASRRICIDMALTYSEDVPFFKQILIPTLLEDRVEIYEERYLKYILSFTIEKGNIEHVVDLMTNDSLFRFSKNLHVLKLLFEYIDEEIDSDTGYVELHAIILLALCSNMLVMLRRLRATHDIVIQFTPTITKILLQDECKSVFGQDSYIESLEPEYLVGYLLQYYYTNDNNFLIPFPSTLYETKAPGDYQRLIRLIVELFPTEDDISQLREALDSSLYNKVISYVRNYILNPRDISVNDLISIG